MWAVSERGMARCGTRASGHRRGVADARIALTGAEGVSSQQARGGDQSMGSGRCSGCCGGASLGALVIASIGWQWASFYLHVPLGLVAMGRGATLLTETKRTMSEARGVIHEHL